MSLAEEKVRELMTKEIDTIDLDRTARDAAVVISKRSAGCVVVVRSQMVAGIVTEQDIVSKVTANGVDPSKVLVRDVMSTPVITVKPHTTVAEAARLMSEYTIRRLVVVGEDGTLTGLITAEDLAKRLAKRNNYGDAALNAIARLKQGPSEGPYQ